jgi:hypothetical protein
MTTGTKTHFFFYLFNLSHSYLILHFLLYDDLTNLIAGLVLSLIAGMKKLAFHATMIFKNCKFFSKKHACEKLEGAKLFIAHVMTFVATPPSFRNPITP